MTEYNLTPLGPSPEGPEAIQANVLATGRLLGTLRAEAEHPQSLLDSGTWFEDDGTFDLSEGPTLAELPDPENLENSYMVGLRPDGVGQVVMLQREGGVVGRVVVTLNDGVVTRLLGERRVVDPKSGLAHREIVDGRLAPPDLLDQLGTALPRVFDTQRAYRYNQKPNRLRTIASALWQLAARRGKGDMGQRAIDT